MKRRRQRATTGHKSLRWTLKANTAGAGFEVYMRRPTAAQPVVKPVSNSINLSLRAACCGFRDKAMPAGVARAMNVEKRNLITLTKTITFNVVKLTPYLLEVAD